ncbi:MAG: tRNA (adenosine(37)-N6)-threonylcarbamoyltransferase complex ATPase subunit type 1 TsaE [Maribacter sp.]
MHITYSENQIEKIARQVIENAPSKVLCFYGQMGAGKTTLIKAIVKQLGGAGVANSPTFGIVNEYHDNNDNLLAYHFDFYRLHNEIEAYDLGIEDYLNSDAWIFIEWPEKIESILPIDAAKIQIEVLDPTTRKISYSYNFL